MTTARRTRPHPFRTAFRWSRSPGATAVILLLLVYLNPHPGGFAYECSNPAGPTVSSGAPDEGWMSVIRDRTGLTLVPLGTERPGDNVVGIAQYSYRSRTSADSPLGSRVVEGITVSGTGISVAEIPEVQALYLKMAAARPEPFWRDAARRLATGADTAGVLVRESTFDWLKVVARVATTLLLILFINSLVWLVHLAVLIQEHLQRCFDHLALTPREREHQRRASRLNAGRCPRCRYEIRGLPEPRCPECGERWTAADVVSLQRARVLRSGLCPRCRYDVRGLRVDRCPECGTTW